MVVNLVNVLLDLPISQEHPVLEFDGVMMSDFASNVVNIVNRATNEKI